MAAPILATKLFIPPPRPRIVIRPRLIDRMNGGLHGKLTLVSAPAGFGKTTLVSDWLSGGHRPTAWLSLDEGDSDIARFLQYLVAALRKIDAGIGKAAMAALQSPQAPSPESILTTLLNELVAVPEGSVLVLDDYHMVDGEPVDRALAFLLEHLPPPLHLVVATREDPNLPLARLRARGQMSELRAADLRFTPSEASELFDQGMGFALSPDDIAALEARTEGWVAGLQLAGIALQGAAAKPGPRDASGFIKSFTGSHRYAMDFLIEEVLQQQPEGVQAFLLRTSLLDRMCGPLCDAVLATAPGSGAQTLAYLERANLFIVPLDDERRWFRYHRLFADSLRQRLHQGVASSTGDRAVSAAELHLRASAWYEGSGLEIEAFQHAAAAHDIGRAERLIEGRGMPLYFRGALVPVLTWLKSLPKEELDARPTLWAVYASVVLALGRTKDTEEKLRAAESALHGVELDEKQRDLVGRVAAVRATLAIGRSDVEAIITQSRRALEYLDPANLAFRTSTTWKMGIAYQLQGDRAAACRAFAEAVSASRASGNTVFTLMALAGMGNMQESGNDLRLAAQTYRSVLDLAGDLPFPYAAFAANLGLARIYYEWNDLDASRGHWQQAVQLARQIEASDRPVVCELFHARLKLGQGDVAEAAAILAKADLAVRQHGFTKLVPEVASARVDAALRQGDHETAARLSEEHRLPFGQARVLLAQGNPSAALAALEPMRREAEAKDWKDQGLRVLVLRAVALHAQGGKDEALRLLGEALAHAEPQGFIRTFVDEGAPMARLLAEAAAQGVMPGYAAALLAAFPAGERGEETPDASPGNSLIEALSQRELEVLRLVAQGLSNDEISEKLFIALSTVKGHNQSIFEKLRVQRRTEAVARARELRLL